MESGKGRALTLAVTQRCGSKGSIGLIFLDPRECGSLTSPNRLLRGCRVSERAPDNSNEGTSAFVVHGPIQLLATLIDDAEPDLAEIEQ